MPVATEVNNVEDPITDNSEVLVDKYNSFQYAPIVAADSETPVLSFSNLTIEFVAANAIESAATQSLSFLRKSFGSGEEGAVRSKKVILRKVSGEITSGFWGILGQSGSGKTTLLNALAKRLDPVRISVTGGSIRLNGKAYDSQTLKQFSSYLMQDDLLFAEFTVYETLWYAAYLRLGSAWTAQEREQRINELLTLLEIDHRRDVIVGDTRSKGISGGERKRLALAVELLTKPKLLFLDEPTTGLDSTTALIVITGLKKLVENKETTVISSIHQPSSKIFELLENIILVSHGSIAYLGSSAGALKYFTSLGHPLPFQTNPADHVIEVLSNAVVKVDEAGVVHSSFPFLPITVDKNFGQDRPLTPNRIETNWFIQFGVVFLRSLQQGWRKRIVFISNLVLCILVAIFAAYGPWNDLGESTANLGKRPAVLFYCVIHQGLVYSYQGVHAFPLERAVMLRERQAGSYRVSAYFLGKSFADFVLQIISPIVFSLIVYPVVGLQNGKPLAGSKQFEWFLLFMILSCIAATSMVNMISCLFLSIQLTVVIIGVSFEITRLFGGWFVSPISLTSQYNSWKFADALSYLKYGFVGVSLNEYQGLVLCSNPKIRSTCSQSYSQAQIKRYGYDQYTIEDCAGYLCVLIIGFRIAAYVGLRFIKL